MKVEESGQWQILGQICVKTNGVCGFDCNALENRPGTIVDYKSGCMAVVDCRGSAVVE